MLYRIEGLVSKSKVIETANGFVFDLSEST